MLNEKRVCPICLEEFEPHTSNQKYCSECGKLNHPINELRRLQRLERRIAREYDRVKIKICPECGTEFQTEFNRTYCCDKCKNIAYSRKVNCDYCGANFYANNIPLDHVGGKHHFCCEEHKLLWKQSQLPERVCENCGIPYRSKNTRFCCKDCAIEYSKTHPQKSAKRKPTVELNKQIRKCSICGKKYEESYIMFTSDVPLCSDECRKEYNCRVKAQQSDEKLLMYIRQNGMCGICCTSYVDCERMSSNFRISPKGAKYHEGKIVECPKFKTKQKF